MPPTPNRGDLPTFTLAQVPKRTRRLQASHQMSKGAFGTPDDQEKAAFGAF